MPPSETETTARFGTFTGVFTPTLLTILGVIMYVRIGWVVGNAGLGGALLILGLGLLITTCTGLSLSSIATNTRIGPGGPYAIMNKSLGLEVGGAIGIPLYLTRPLGVAMYIFGFREGIQWVFPSLPSLGIDLAIFALLFGIAFKSADLAFKTQYGIMGVIVLSLLSIFLSPAPFESPHPIVWWGDYPGSPEDGFQGADFWMVFAVFFPATTGILAGANMSGDLKDPRRAIPWGTMSAIALSTVIYFGVALWAAHTGTLEELSENYTHVIDKSLFPPLVLAGLLGATASSALAGLVGGPRILMAMGQNDIIPWGERMAQTSHGEPRNAMVLTGVLTLAAIAVRDLNAIAPLVTMFFLITYCMINVVVLIEGSLGLVSYRPTLALPPVVPLVGLVGCLFSMFIVNPTFSLISIGLVGATYFFIRARHARPTTSEDVRSSIFVAFAEWAASKVTTEDLNNVRAWKPHLLVPVEDVEALRGSYPVLVDLARPEGTVKLLGIGSEQSAAELTRRLTQLCASLREQHVLASSSLVDLPGYTTAVGVGMKALQGAFFRPNLLFLRLAIDAERRAEQTQAIRMARNTSIGVVLFSPHPRAGLGQRQHVQLWVRPPVTGWDPNAAFETASLNLILLTGYRLWRVWKGRLTLVTVAPSDADGPSARRFLDELCDLARFPDAVERKVLFGDLDSALRQVSVPDVSIFGLNREGPNLDDAERVTLESRSTCLFVLDSGRESARA